MGQSLGVGFALFPFRSETKQTILIIGIHFGSGFVFSLCIGHVCVTLVLLFRISQENVHIVEVNGL